MSIRLSLSLSFFSLLYLYSYKKGGRGGGEEVALVNADTEARDTNPRAPKLNVYQNVSHSLKYPARGVAHTQKPATHTADRPHVLLLFETVRIEE